MNFQKGGCISSLSVIDWDLVTLGPAFLDVGNFVAELFCTGYLNGVDSTYAEVLESFIVAYRAAGGVLDIVNARAFIGVGIIESLPRRLILSKRGTPAMAMKCAECAVELIMNAGSVSGEDDLFSGLSRILRDREV